jgi:hypothetical protein
VTSPADIQLEPDTIVQPDMFVVPLSGDEKVEVISEELIWHPAGAAAPFALSVPDFFQKVRGSI